jgi:hypothetical protein
MIITGRGRDSFLTAASRVALGSTNSPIYWVSGDLPPGVKQPGHEADYQPPPVPRFKNAQSYTSTPSIRHYDMVLNYARGVFSWFVIH